MNYLSTGTQQFVQRRSIIRLSNFGRRWISTTFDLADLLGKVERGEISAEQAHKVISLKGVAVSKEGIKTVPESNFANLDLNRTNRTGFPEVSDIWMSSIFCHYRLQFPCFNHQAIYGSGKTPQQVASILERMAKHVNENVEQSRDNGNENAGGAILATRISREEYEKISSYTFNEGSITYHEMAGIIAMRANAMQRILPNTQMKKVVVACAGTTDLPVAEEAAVTLEETGVRVEKVYDCGVAGLHRILNALPTLRNEEVGAVIVCAGMDGALPSVVGGLVSVPVIAVPTSVGYGVSLGGVSALLTMLNSCSPGVGVVNVDNGFGAAALAFKCIKN